jgi:ribonuclease HI
MILRAFTDGASRGNPGEAGIGILVRDEKSETVLSLHGYIGVCTNNVAEYTAMELNGRYRVKDSGLKSHHARAVALMKSLPFPCSVTHIPREENREADRLANLGIDEKIPV